MHGGNSSLGRRPDSRLSPIEKIVIEHYGTFDVANYGDLLFPLILQKRLGSVYEDFEFISPVGGPPPVAGGVTSLAPRELTQPPTGLIVGGGHLIHGSPSPVETYRSSPNTALQAYPSLWLGSAHRAIAHHVPLIWNAPGVPAEFGSSSGALVRWVMSICDYVAVRDARSLRLIQDTGFEGEAHVVPDTAHDIRHLYSADALRTAYEKAFKQRKAPLPKRTIVFHLKERYLGEELGFVAARIDRICESADAEPILIGLGACHGDDAMARDAGALLKTRSLIIDQPRSLIEVVACLAHASAYIGSSLHGAITACAFGTRALIVANEGPDGGKFSEYFDSQELGAWHLADWTAAEALATEFLECDDQGWIAVARRVDPELDRHWERVESALSEPPRHVSARASATKRFQELTREELQPAGIYAALLAEQAQLGVSQQSTISTLKTHAKLLKASYRESNRALRRKLTALEKNGDDQDPRE